MCLAHHKHLAEKRRGDANYENDRGGRKEDADEKEEQERADVDVAPSLPGPFRLALRIQMSKDQVGYTIGMHEQQLSDEKLLVQLDNELVHVLHTVDTSTLDILIELVFCIQERVSTTTSKTQSQSPRKPPRHHHN